MTDAPSLESRWAGCAEVIETLEEEERTARSDRLGAASCVLGEAEALADAPLIPLPFAVARTCARPPVVAARRVREDGRAVRGIAKRREWRG
jgi:hypothetical protein